MTHKVVMMMAAVVAAGLTARPGVAAEGTWADVTDLAAGVKVEVIYTPMKRAFGVVMTAEDEAITVDTETGAVRIPRGDVRRVSVYEKSLKKRALVGAAIGAGTMAAVAAVGAKSRDIDFTHAYLIGGAAAIGGGVGAAVGATTAGPTVIYRGQ